MLGVARIRIKGSSLLSCIQWSKVELVDEGEVDLVVVKDVED